MLTLKWRKHQGKWVSFMRDEALKWLSLEALPR
jgi:hypothetical protein